MTTTSSSPPPVSAIERLLSSLEGIVSASVVPGHDGRLLEVHVLATTSLHPKQVVRNVESALRAGFGIGVDRRVISVAQTPVAESEAGEPDGAAEVESPAPSVPVPLSTRQVLYSSYSVHREFSGKVSCSVSLYVDGKNLTGRGEAPDTSHGRVEAAARAVFAALHNGDHAGDVGIEGARLISAHNRDYVLVSGRGLRKRQPVTLAGAAAVSRSAEEAAILAALQAINRWEEITR